MKSSLLRSTVGLTLIGVLATWAWVPARADVLQVEIQPKSDHSLVDLRLRGVAPAGSAIETRLQRSIDLKTWSPFGAKLRLPAQADAAGVKLAEDSAALGFYRLSTRATTFTATDGADILGYISSLADEIEALGDFTQRDFAERFGFKGEYLPGIRWNPRNALYWDAFQKDVHKPRPGNLDLILPALKLSQPEFARFRTNGFVVSERLGNDSFGDVYYDIFNRDLPVFISTDSILHAWHRSFDAVLQVIEEGHLRGQLRDLLLGMLGQLAAARTEYGNGVLKSSLDDGEYFLAVAAHLVTIDSERPTPIPADAARFNTTRQLIEAGKPRIYQIFDSKQDSEIVDFSQYIPRSHYSRHVSLQRYFQAMMWLGRVDLRIAGNPEYASLRQLGTAIVLNDLLNRSGKRATWQRIDHLITTLIGPPDSMNFDQLDALLKVAAMASPASIASTAALDSLRVQLENGTLGTQAIQGHSFYGGAGNDQIKLPRSFTFLGQRFAVDSWTFSQVVLDRIVLPGSEPPQLVRRRLPYSLDVDFAVFANDQIVPELLANMANPNGIPFRDGFPYQRNLAAVRQVLDGRPADAWTGTLYDGLLGALRTLSEPTLGPEYPEVMRTRAWALKTVNTQLASWSQLRHDTVLYVKQSETPPQLCLYPKGFVEPRPAFFQAMKALALQAADTIQAAGLPDVLVLEGPTFHDFIFSFPTAYPPDLILTSPPVFFRRFATNCNTLAEISVKELRQQPLLPGETYFLENTIEQVNTYLGSRQYNGWYPQLFYWGMFGNGEPNPPYLPNQVPPNHDSVFPDFLVTDVHTDGPSDTDLDPGAVLHEGVGRVNLLMIAVDNGPDRMVFAGPVMSHYEFTKPYGTRMTDAEWSAAVNAKTLPAPPPWTQSYLVRKP